MIGGGTSTFLSNTGACLHFHNKVREDCATSPPRNASHHRICWPINPLGVVFNSTSRREAKRGLHERKESEGRDDRAFNFLFSYFLSSLMTTMLSIAQMFAATYRLKKPVTLVLLIFVHSLPMVAAHAQEIK